MLGEFALVTVDRTRVQQLAEEDDRGAARVLAAIRRLSFNLSGAQLGITMTSIVLGFVGEPAIAALTEPVLDGIPGVDVEPGTGVSVLVALAIATTAQMVLGELVPKSWAIARPLGTARFVVVPFSWFAAVFGSLISLLNEAANLVVRVFRVEPREELSAVRSLDEVHFLIRSSVEEGTLREGTFPLVSRAITFFDKTAARALVPRTSVVYLLRSAAVADLVETSKRSGHSRFLVVDEDLDDVVGVAHVKDAGRIDRSAWADTSIEALTAEVLVVPESRDLPSLFTEMRSGRHQLVVVVDEYGGTAGIVTVEDILEEIVGDIEDEYDPARFTPVTRSGQHVVSGMTRADELRELTGFELPPGDYETLAGFLLSELGRIPSAGARVRVGDWIFEVLAMSGRRIERVRVTPPPEVVVPGGERS